MAEVVFSRKKFIRAILFLNIALSALCIAVMLVYALNKVVIVSAGEEEVQTEEAVLLTAPSGSWKIDTQSDDELGKFYIPVDDYLTYSNMRVYERPDEGTFSLIFDNVDPSHFIYAKAHGDFANVTGATGTYNDNEVMISFDVTPLSEVNLSYIKKEIEVTVTPYELRDVPIVVVDASYGGSANGNMVGDVMEKDLTLALAETIRKMANDRPYRIVLTRTMDVTMNTKTRLNLMDTIGADYYIGIRLMANVDDVKQYGLVATYNDVYYRDGLENVSFAESVLQNAAEMANNRALELKPAGEDSVIIRALDVPALDFYAGFMTNSEECELLQKDSYLEKLALGVLTALDEVIE